MTLNQSSAHVLATRRAAVFNSRYPVGRDVMFISAPGADPIRGAVASRAFVAAGMVKVYLQGYAAPVDADRCFTPPQAEPERCRERVLPVWQCVAFFVLGFATAVVLGLLGPTAHAVPPAMISIDCDAPGAARADVELVDQDGRAQA